MRRGFHHIGLATYNFDRCVDFYTRVLGFEIAWQDLIESPDGDVLMQHVFFDTGDGTCISFMAPTPAMGAPESWECDQSKLIGLMPATYHFSFMLESLEELEAKRQELESKGVDATEIIDHDFCKSVYFHDPDGLVLEFAITTRAFNDDDKKPTNKPQPTFEAFKTDVVRARRFAKTLGLPEEVLSEGTI
jgi:catechol 2,3-dioxygenase-like lactoylglutathione lyase family enzyme